MKKRKTYPLLKNKGAKTSNKITSDRMEVREYIKPYDKQYT